MLRSRTYFSAAMTSPQQHHDQLLVRVDLEQHVERKLRGAGIRMVNCSAAMSLDT